MARSGVVRAEEAKAGARCGGYPCPGYRQDAGRLRETLDRHTRRVDDGSARRAPPDGRKDAPTPRGKGKPTREKDRARLAVLTSRRPGLARRALVVLVEAASCLPPYTTFGGHLAQALRRISLLVAGRL